MRYNNRLTDFSLLLSAWPIQVELSSAIIVVARVAMLRPIRAGTPRMPHVMTLVLANYYGRLLAVYDSGPQDGATVYPGVVYFDGTRSKAAEMRRHILEQIGNINYLVGFHLAWTLTALSLALPASRVLDLGT